MVTPKLPQLAFELHKEPELPVNAPDEEPSFDHLTGIGAVTYATDSETSPNRLGGIVDLSIWKEHQSTELGASFGDLGRWGWAGLRAKTRVTFADPELLAAFTSQPYGTDASTMREAVSANLGTETSLVVVKPLIRAELKSFGRDQDDALYLPDQLRQLSGSILAVLVVQLREGQPVVGYAIDNRNSAYPHTINSVHYGDPGKSPGGDKMVVNHTRFMGSREGTAMVDIFEDFRRASAAFLAQKAVAESATFALSLEA